jgi:nicotinamide riboside kinase
MKIALIGTHGIGKTTLAYGITTYLKKQGKHAGMLAEVTWRCPFKINKETSIKSQLWLLATQIKEELELEEKFDYVVCDRSAIDNFIYTLNAVGHENALPYESMVLDRAKSYDLLFKLPLKKEFLVPDGIRDTDREFQKKIDDLLEDYLKQKNIEHVKIVPGMDYLEQITGYLKI